MPSVPIVSWFSNRPPRNTGAACNHFKCSAKNSNTQLKIVVKEKSIQCEIIFVCGVVLYNKNFVQKCTISPEPASTTGLATPGLKIMLYYNCSAQKNVTSLVFSDLKSLRSTGIVDNPAPVKP